MNHRNATTPTRAIEALRWIATESIPIPDGGSLATAEQLAAFAFAVLNEVPPTKPCYYCSGDGFDCPACGEGFEAGNA